ncbi:MAG: HAMP domain-containing histidine kinase [Bacteroidales bacterium]|nr:HAMP domain-containing histidine kinase [Bacteroidales bacterium]
MKKRIIISLFFVVGITSILLILSIFRLYTEAEKVQRSIFVNEVLTAGDEIVDKIDALIKNDTLSEVKADSVEENHLPDTTEVVSMQRARRFLLDTVSFQPIGIIQTVIFVKENNSRVVENDTSYFSEAYRKMFPLNNDPWSPKNSKGGVSPIVANMDVNLIQMDSSTIQLLSPEYLYRLIKSCLAEENIDARFDFAVYNAFTTDFVVMPQFTEEETMLHSEYVFRLKYNEKVTSPNYIILYFPAERGIFLQRMSTIVSLIICLLIVCFTISFVALYSLYRQKKLSEVTNEFVNNMTHEFKTPISTISLACEALSDPSLHNDASMREAYINIIRDENDRLKGMVNNILQIAQLKKGQVKMNMELLDMHELIHKVTDSVALQISSTHGSLNLALNADTFKIFGDRHHLENVIINLVENGIKYSTAHPEILINTQSDKKYFLLSVTDKGIGIPKKALPSIFDNFYRVPKGNVHDVKGYGLGLGYVKKIIALHHGHIEVQSEEGKGSTFVVYLPLKH